VLLNNVHVIAMSAFEDVAIQEYFKQNWINYVKPLSCQRAFSWHPYLLRMDTTSRKKRAAGMTESGLLRRKKHFSQ
jgi:hypothetical protein